MKKQNTASQILSRWAILNAIIIIPVNWRLSVLILEALTLTDEIVLTVVGITAFIGILQWVILKWLVPASRAIVIAGITGWLISFTIVSGMSLSIADFLDSSSQWGNPLAVILIPIFVLGVVAIGPIVFSIVFKFLQRIYCSEGSI